MAYSTTVQAAHEDVPLFVTENAVELTSSVHRWTTVGNIASTDETDSDYPVTNAFDRFLHKLTKPDSSDTEWYLVFRADNTIDVNTILIGGHNFDQAGAAVTAEVQISDDGSTWASLHTFSATTSGKRLYAETVLNYMGVEYLRIKITCDLAFTPEIGEFFVGPKQLLDHQPNIPWDDQSLRSQVSRFKPKSGIITTYVFSAGGRFGSMTLQPDSTAEIDLIRNVFKNTNFGTKPFLFVDHPNATTPNAYWMVMDPELDMPLQGPSDRLTTINLEEMSPYVSSES